jgi:hypothetical protein
MESLRSSCLIFEVIHIDDRIMSSLSLFTFGNS